MGFFFRKRIKILPGLNLNLSKNGCGFSFGPKGCKISINPKGETYLNAGKGGFYLRKKLNNFNENNVVDTDNLTEDLCGQLEKSRKARAEADEKLKIYYEYMKMYHEGDISKEILENKKRELFETEEETKQEEESDTKFLIITFWITAFLIFIIILMNL